MGKPLHFKGSTFHRVIPDFMCQVDLSRFVPHTFCCHSQLKPSF